jgi:sulfate adenylyltransferase subunit 2
MSTSPVSTQQRYEHLDRLESQSVYIMREAFAKFENLAMLWSIGKDSNVMMWLARKAFFCKVPFPVVHVDTHYKIPEMIEFRDKQAKELGLDLVVGENTEVLKSGITFPNGKATRVECCGSLKKDALQATLHKHGYKAVFAGIRRDEEGTRAKERYFSPRGKDFAWDFKDQPPELWDQFKTDFEPDTHIRIHPLLHWTEINIWEYIHQEAIPVVGLYFAKNGKRYRSLGCAPCTSMVDSTAVTVPEIIAELRGSKIAERSTRAQDAESEHAFEQLRAQGYM